MKRRMNNIFRQDGKSFILAMDHGGGVNVLPELNETGEIIKKARLGGVDGFLVTYGMAVTFAEEIGNTALLLRMDGMVSELNVSNNPMELMYTVEDAVRLGADGVLCMGFPGATNERESMKSITSLVSQGAKWNIPVGAEMLPRGFEFDKFEDLRSAYNIKLSSRIGCELGLDFIKTEYTGDKKSFKELIDGCYKPVLILGGGNSKSNEEILTLVKDALDCGAKGVIMGRNIWRHDNPEKICAAITSIVHNDFTVEQALKTMI
ncbi:aldolase [Alkalibaculum sp. M08DMB]|uniref:Aldolase n=1 Tax=Alkalibaculum sporogenes TaxID=2655001 RepID=A0A6A7K8C2_9FIRM|nr:aldolase [Alkalibaculum sporogenes]MPW25626.1 aldolase [Alkalibaculum sporogenes]